MENTNTAKFRIDDLLEDQELDSKIVQSFNLKNFLSPDIFEVVGDKNYKMKSDVRDRLLSIADAFISSMDNDFFIYDVLLVGSTANYNWSEYSDIDLHILIDFSEIFDNNSDEMIKMLVDYFDSKKHVWNLNHDIKLKNYDVEVYVQNIGEKNVSAGVYSILNNEWIVKPKKHKMTIDKEKIFEKANLYSDIIEDLAGQANDGIDITDDIIAVRQKLKKFRQSGLQSGGEYSYENLVFKLLRRNGVIDKLMKLKKQVIDKKLSLSQ